MARLFGYSVDPGFDAAREERQDRVKRALIIAAVLGIVYDAVRLPFGVEVFQISLATVTCYGITFYVARKSSNAWLWKAILLTLPIHAAYVACIFWIDHASPYVMTRAYAFIPLLFVTCGIELLIFERIVRLFDRAYDLAK